MITQPYVNFIQPDAGGNIKPISNGTIYIGKEGLDPKLGGNSIYYRDNGGNEVEISNPLYLNMTGVIVDGPSSSNIINPYTKEPISILILDRNGKEVWSELSDVSQFVSFNDLGYRSFISANSVSDMVSKFGVADIGKRIVIDDYYGTESPSGSGILFFNVVADSSGLADEGAYVQGNGIQFKQDLPLKPTVKNWGAKGDKVNDDTPACEAMYAYKGYIQLSGLNRVTKGFTPKTHNFRMYGEGMWSERTKLVIDHEEIIFTHGEEGKNFQAEGFKLQDLHVVLMDGRTPSTNQHFYKPLCANAWKEWKNIKADGIGGLMNAWPGDGVDVYCQRWDVDNVRLFDCGAWAGWLGDITVEMKRPIGTICQIADVDLKAMRGHPLAIAWFDMRGWRQIEQTGTVEIGNSPEADQYTNIKSVAAYKSNSPIDISTIWYEPYPNAVTNITDIIFCDKWPTSAVDGESGTVIKINDIEATRQGTSLSGGSSLVRFAKGTYYDVQIATVGSTYSYYIQPQYLAKFEDPLLENKNKLSIKNFFWRYENNKPIMPMPLPYRFYGHVSIENVATNTNNVISPQLNFDKSPLIYEWYAQTSTVRPDDVNTSMFGVDLSVGIDTVGFATHKDFFALNVEKNNGVPRIRYLVNALPDMIGAWCTVAINYVNVSQDTQGTPLVISNSNGDAANPFSFNEANKNGTGYSTAVFSFQIKQQTTRLDAYYRDVELTMRNNFYIQSITARLGNEIKLNRMFK